MLWLIDKWELVITSVALVAQNVSLSAWTFEKAAAGRVVVVCVCVCVVWCGAVEGWGGGGGQSWRMLLDSWVNKNADSGKFMHKPPPCIPMTGRYSSRFSAAGFNCIFSHPDWELLLSTLRRTGWKKVEGVSACGSSHLHPPGDFLNVTTSQRHSSGGKLLMELPRGSTPLASWWQRKVLVQQRHPSRHHVACSELRWREHSEFTSRANEFVSQFGVSVLGSSNLRLMMSSHREESVPIPWTFMHTWNATFTSDFSRFRVSIPSRLCVLI